MVARVYDAQVNFYDDERKKIRDIAHSLFDIGRIQCFVGDFSESDVTIHPFRHPPLYVDPVNHKVKISSDESIEDARLFLRVCHEKGLNYRVYDLATDRKINL